MAHLKNSLPESVQSQLLAKAKRVKLRRRLETSQIAFTKYFFRVRKETFVPGEQHAKIEDALLALERGELVNEAGETCYILVVTIMPRAGKTQIAVIDWMARSVARNPKAKFIHLSYSDDLALDNSAKCRETVLSAEYRALWPVKLKRDSDSKKKWYTEEGGGVYATAAGGPVTGFGAGSVSDGANHELIDEFDEFFAGDPTETDDGKFYGAIVIDDPIKVEDAYNGKERDKVNKRLNTTIKSRRNSRKTPIVIIMQRLAEDDMAGFVLDGGMGGEPVYHLNLPAVMDFEMQKDDATQQVKLCGRSLWPHKHTMEDFELMINADYATFMAQYMQDPTPEQGTFFKAEWFANCRFRLGEEPTKLVKYGAGDYAVAPETPGSKKLPDASEQAIAGFDLHDHLWFLDWWTGRVTLDKSIEQQMLMVINHDPVLWLAEKGVIRHAMEPFVIKEQIRRRLPYMLEWLAANASKAVNAKAFQALCSQGRVHIPYGPWGDALIAQLLKFTGHDDKEDDKVDVCGLFGRALHLEFGPAQYHESLHDKEADAYGSDYEDDSEESGDWRIA